MHGTYGSDLHGNTVDEHYFESEIPDLWFASHTLAKREYTAIQAHTELYHDLSRSVMVGVAISHFGMMTPLWAG